MVAEIYSRPNKRKKLSQSSFKNNSATLFIYHVQNIFYDYYSKCKNCDFCGFLNNNRVLVYSIIFRNYLSAARTSLHCPVQTVLPLLNPLCNIYHGKVRELGLNQLLFSSTPCTVLWTEKSDAHKGTLDLLKHCHLSDYICSRCMKTGIAEMPDFPLSHFFSPQSLSLHPSSLIIF